MKNRLLWLLMLFSTLSVSAQTENSYRVEGKVSGMNTKKVYLTTMKKLSDKNFYVAVIDSSEVIRDQFILQKDTSLIEPSWSSAIYYIDTVAGAKMNLNFQIADTKTSQTFTLDWGNTTVTGNLSKDPAVAIHGSKEADFLSQYNELLSHDAYYYTSMRKLDSLRRTTDTTAYYQTKVITDSLDQSFKSQLAGAIVSNPTSWLALVNAYQNAKKFDYLQLKIFENDFGPKLLETPTGKKFTDYISAYQSVQVGSHFPDFTYYNTSKKRIHLEDVKGKNGTLVIFWASWCGPCSAEIPYLKNIYEKYRGKGINFVSIATDSNIGSWTKALNQQKMPWPNLAQLSPSKESTSLKYSFSNIPSMFLLDDRNKIIIADEYRSKPLLTALDKLSKYAK